MAEVDVTYVFLSVVADITVVWFLMAQMKDLDNRVTRRLEEDGK